MKKIFLFLFLLAEAVDTVAQTYPLKEYNSLVNKAEMAFIDGSYATADSLYQRAFKGARYPYVTDIQNALINALKGSSYKSGFSYAFMLSKLGVGSPYFTKNAFISERLGREKSAWERLIADADRNRSFFDRKYAGIIDTLKRYHKSVEDLINLYYQDAAIQPKALAAGLQDYADSLYTLFDKNGYVSEYDIGVNIEADTVIAPPLFSNVISYARYVPGSGGAIEIAYNDRFGKPLQKALYEGKISPYFFYAIYTDPDFIPIAYSPAYRIANTIFIPYMAHDDIVAISNKRLRYGLAGIDDYKEQLKYYFGKTEGPFKLPVNISALATGAQSLHRLAIPL